MVITHWPNRWSNHSKCHYLASNQASVWMWEMKMIGVSEALTTMSWTFIYVGNLEFWERGEKKVNVKKSQRGGKNTKIGHSSLHVKCYLIFLIGWPKLDRMIYIMAKSKSKFIEILWKETTDVYRNSPSDMIVPDLFYK